ncbi:MAG: KH domain-containing protein [candidate division WOR-3 bacterium]
MAKLPADQEFLQLVVQSLVKNPDAVKIDRKIDEMGVLLTLTVSPEDMGTVIGRQGNTARAIRTLLRVIGAKNNARVNLKLEEPAGAQASQGGNAAKEKKSSVEDVVKSLEL